MVEGGIAAKANKPFHCSWNTLIAHGNRGFCIRVHLADAHSFSLCRASSVVFYIFQYHSTYSPTSVELFMVLVLRMGKSTNCAHFANGNKGILSTIARLDLTTHPQTLHPGCVSSRGFSAGGRSLPSFATIATQCTYRAQVFSIQTLAD